MSDIITMNLANSGNYGAARRYDAIKYIVIHYTGNDGDTAVANGNYFARNVLQTSAHYFVDSVRVIQSVPDNRIAWHCGGKQYFHPECRNSNSIGVELCDDKRDGTVYPSKATIDRALELVQALMQKYNIPPERVVRHWDVTHKLCPAYWCGSPSKDALWRSAFWSKLKKPKEEQKVTYEDFKAFMIKYEAETREQKADSYAAEACRKGVQKGIFSDGNGDGSVDAPQAYLKRQEFVAVLDRMGLLD